MLYCCQGNSLQKNLVPFGIMTYLSLPLIFHLISPYEAYTIQGHCVNHLIRGATVFPHDLRTSIVETLDRRRHTPNQQQNHTLISATRALNTIAQYYCR